MKKTILIFGISSFVGSNLASILKDEYRIIGTYFETPIDIPGITCVPCNVLSKDYVFKLMAIFKPDYTIYGVGLSSLTLCNLYPKRADALNSAGAANCAGASERFNSKFIYLSSCFVMGGEDVVYKESDTPFPSSVYGSSLSSTEFYIQRSCLNYLILRTSPLYGRSFNPHHPNWFEVLQAFIEKESQLAANDTIKTGHLDIYIFGRILKSLLASGVTNRLLQVSSQDSLTRYEFAKVYAKVFHKDHEVVRPSTFGFPVLDSNGSNLVAKGSVRDQQSFVLDTSNIEELLGVAMPSVEESLQVTFKRMTTRRA